VRRLTLVLAVAVSLFVGIAVAPSTVLAKAPITQSACACGGSVTVVGRAEYCSSPDFISVLTWYSNGSSSLVTYFEPVRC
jgi:hypothetical protein